MSEVKHSLWVQLSMSIAQVPCNCTEHDSCQPHELLDLLYAQINGQIPQTA